MGKSIDKTSFLGSTGLALASEETDFDVTIQIIETEDLEKQLDEFASITGEAVFKYTMLAEPVLKEMKREDFFIEYWRWRRGVAALNTIKRGNAEIEAIDRKKAELEAGLKLLKEEVQEFLESGTPEKQIVAKEIWESLKNAD